MTEISERQTEQFKESVQRLRKDRQVSQAQLADMLKSRGLSFFPQTVQRIEEGTRSVKLREAIAIADAFQVELSAMLAIDRGDVQFHLGDAERVRHELTRLAEDALMKRYLLAKAIDDSETDLEDPRNDDAKSELEYSLSVAIADARIRFAMQVQGSQEMLRAVEADEVTSYADAEFMRSRAMRTEGEALDLFYRIDNLSHLVEEDEDDGER